MEKFVLLQARQHLLEFIALIKTLKNVGSNDPNLDKCYDGTIVTINNIEELLR